MTESKTTENKKNYIAMIVGMGLLTAVVVVLQALAVSIRFGVFNITLVLAPIIVGAALYGKWAGAWLGFVFGVVVLMTDAGAFLAVNVPGTIVTCIAKGVLAGFMSGYTYELICKRSKLAAVMTAGVISPIMNTGIFLLGCGVFFIGTISEWAAGAGFDNAWLYMLTVFVGLNFLVELAINLVLSSVIVTLIEQGLKTIRNR